jgi:DNA-binding transcriptional regulator YiaG
MTDKTMLNFRCPADLLDAINAIGQQRYPSETAKHGCDRTKTLLDIVRAGIEALSENPTVLQVSDNSVRQRKTEEVNSTEELPGKFERLSEAEIEALRQELAETKHQYIELLETSASKVQEIQTELETVKNAQPSAEFELPEPADALNHLKAIRKKSRADLGDIEALWEIIEKFRHNPAD